MTNEFAYTSPQSYYGDPLMGQGVHESMYMPQDNQMNPNQRRFIPGVPFLGGLLLGSLVTRPYWYRPYPRPYPYYPYPYPTPYPYNPYWY